MNAAHIHLVLNHVPVFGTLFAAGLLAFGLWRHNHDLQKVAFGSLVLVALLTVPAFFTGEPAEDALSGLSGISKPIIEQHEDLAQTAFVALSILGVVTLAFLLKTDRKALLPGWMAALVLAGSLLVSGLMAWTANLGGQARHTEIRAAAGTPATASGQDKD